MDVKVPTLKEVEMVGRRAVASSAERLIMCPIGCMKMLHMCFFGSSLG